MSKPILCLDFDGVLHSYTSGWQGATEIPDPPVLGAMESLVEAVEHFEVHIYSSRSHQEGGIEAMQHWTRGYLLLTSRSYPTFSKLIWPTVKPPAFLTIDDRAISFTGEWPSMETLKAFQPWYKR